MASTLFSPGTVVRSIWLNEVDKATHNALTAVAGTNTISATGPLTSVAYVTGDRFFFVPAITNTGATTININGLGAKNLTKYGISALVAGDLVSGTAAQIYYDGVQFQLQNPQTVNVNEVGRLLNVQKFTASGTYTPTAGTNKIVVTVVGAGGGGGGGAATIAGQVSVGGGGGAGGFSQSLFTGVGSTTVTIAAGGAGNVGAAGGTPGNTSFGALLIVGGGVGGSTGPAGALSFAFSVLGGSSGTGNIVSQSGAPGDPAIATFAVGWAKSGFGGVNLFGGGGSAGITTSSSLGAGSPSFGSGGGGGCNVGAQAAVAGGAGGGGLIIVYEYS